MTTRRRILRLYPAWWRARYGAEVEALLDDDQARGGDRLDLLRGALDAHLHPLRPRRITATAALTGGALWTAAAMILTAQPVQADWPGYIVEALPLATMAVACLLVAVCGVWLRLGDGADAFARLALTVAVVGHLAWLAALAAAIAGIAYGSTTAMAATAAAIGTALVGVALLRAQDWPLAGFVAAAPAGLLIGGATGWLAFGLAWSAAGLLLFAAARNGRAPTWAG